MRYMMVVVGMLAMLLAACSDQTNAQDEYVEGRHFVELSQPVRTSDPSKIEVNEIFAYTCGHCFNFQSPLRAWKANLADDVDFLQTPAMWNNQMEVYGRGYYTARALGILDDVHMAIFNHLHVERRTLNSRDQWVSFLSGYGVEEEEVLSTFDSFSVTSQVRQADARARGYQIAGTPEMVVNGQYRVSTQFNGVDSHSDILNIVDFLVEKVRAERAN
ncbi:thiol:disulfide interchange protein DsbA/DsbL [Marinimicrobium alkaliphilum]|uniref:thiol:disulfide interchange protein DsbA/DsbL n=1 Tax=Marinimicrobium alkaliphilum TaxID=2202654 RepID=UPI001E4B5594|nr:thiol:disulfide interchange protein DsbA/DsbL [Marinimicrobium alkaliphilum]